MEWELASLAVRAKREELHEQVPEICTDDWEARRTWTITLDEMLELVASGKGHWADLSTTTKNFLHLLERAGVVKKHWELGLPTYRLTEKGEAHRQVGLQEIQEMHAVVPELFALVTTEQAPPEMIVGRLQHAGVHLRGSRLEFRRLGRSLEAGEQIRAAGIDPLTPMIPDFDWWQWYWRRRYELPPILARVVLRPDELPAQWPVGPLDVQKSTLVSSPSVQEAFHCKTRKSTPRHPVIPVQPQETPSLTPSAAPQVNQEEKPDGHKR